LIPEGLLAQLPNFKTLIEELNTIGKIIMVPKNWTAKIAK
jgi:hypothetical protein